MRIIRIIMKLTSIIITTCWVCNAETDNSQKLVPVEDLKSDFESLYSNLKHAHANLYAHRSKQEYDALYQSMLSGFKKPISLFEAKVSFQKFTAYGNVAHARIDFPTDHYTNFRDNDGRSFPIYLRIANGRAYVGENYSDNTQIRSGDEILTLQDKPMPEWLSSTAQHISADTPYIAHSLLEFTFPQYLWLEIGEIEMFKLSLQQRDGTIFHTTVHAKTRQEQQEIAQNLPARFALTSNKRSATMLDDKIAYLRPGPFYNFENPENIWDNTASNAFIDAAFNSFQEANADTLIIDLRGNPGGNNSFSDPMLSWIADQKFRFASKFLIRSSAEAAQANQKRLDSNPDGDNSVSALLAQKYSETPFNQVFEFDIPYTEPRAENRFNGQVYALINRHSYSNAVNVASIIKDYNFGIIVGEKTSDMATTYGAMETFTLPHTKISVGFPKAHIIRPSGNPESDGVTPDLVIASPILPSETDIVLEKLLDMINADN